jgi:hypothetical protein
MIWSVGSEGGNFWVKARRRGELLRRENFLLDWVATKVNGGIGHRRSGLLRSIMALVEMTGNDEGKLRGREFVAYVKGVVVQ